MIFQDPQASLNPVYRVGHQVEWILKLHRALVGTDAKVEVLRLFEAVQLRDPERCYRCYPHELSGGMCQRVMIAMAIACRPKLLIADEPTSALDVTIQAEIVELLAKLRVELQMAMLFITHDLGLAAHLCSKVVVLQAGTVAECGPTSEVFTAPKAGYTRKLLQSTLVSKYEPQVLNDEYAV
jgi:ABC-type dipeptide/oligopeptide/nickel transport system ATPase component